MILFIALTIDFFVERLCRQLRVSCWERAVPWQSILCEMKECEPLEKLNCIAGDDSWKAYGMPFFQAGHCEVKSLFNQCVS
jgi:hypothetical protein